MKSFTRNLSPPAEFFVVTLVCFWWGIVGSFTALANRWWGVPSSIDLTENQAWALIVLELSAFVVTFRIGRARGWSFQLFGLKLGWKLTAAGVVLCLAAAVAACISVSISNAFFPKSSHFLPVISRVSLPLVIFVSIINSVFEEAIEVGYFVWSLERHGMWIAVLASALFRTFLHAYQGFNAIVVILPIGLIFGFVYWKQRQLWPLIIAHALFDLYALFPWSHRA